MRLHTRFISLFCLPFLGACFLFPALALACGKRHGFNQTIQKVVQMPVDQDLRARVRRHGLRVINVMWEDTGRFGGSSVGPNISDLTLQVREKGCRGTFRTHLLPVIRYPNFSDKTGDIKAEKFWVPTGNKSKYAEKQAVPLTHVLNNLKSYLSDPSSLKGDGNFLAERDTHFLVSAQHVFVPLPKGGKAEFNPVLYNYQSSPGQPAVLTLLITREGTSATIIENKPGDQSLQQWGQQLFFNNAGQKTVFTAERISDVKKRIETQGEVGADKGALEKGSDVMMIVQVPLKHKNPTRFLGSNDGTLMLGSAPAMPEKQMESLKRGKSDMERAVIGHGEDMGPFNEMGGLELERDDRFPVRVTVQFYKGTSNGVISDADLEEVSTAIAKVYKNADYVGSLVVPNGPRHRPTDWIANKPKWPWPIHYILD